MDAFLEHNSAFLQIGKAVIACALIPKEEEMVLFRDGADWLGHLFRTGMNVPFEEFGANKLAVITFNYDRAVEYFFHTALMNKYGVNSDQAADALKNIPIIHLHGRLSHLPWQHGKKVRPYSVAITAEAVADSAAEIKVIHEKIDPNEDDDFRAAKALLHDAEKIAFLGFGYSTTNVERLDIRNLPPDRAWGTCRGLITTETKAIGRMCDGKIRFAYGNHDCFRALRENFVPE